MLNNFKNLRDSGLGIEEIKRQLESEIGLDSSEVEILEKMVDFLENNPETVIPEEGLLKEEAIKLISRDAPFATEAVPFEHPPKYHLDSILFYFGSTTRPDWDPELENNVFSSGLNKEEIVRNSRAVLEGFGPKLFIFALKTDGKLEEFHELIQLQFCCLRNLARGPRTKNALVPISSLAGFAAKLQAPVSSQVEPEPEVRGDFVEPLESVSQIGGPRAQDEDTVLGEAQLQPQVVESEERQGVQVQVTPSQAFKDILDNYRERPFDDHGKPRFNQDIIDQTKIHRGNFIGPNSLKDPCQVYRPAFTIRTKSIRVKN
jgi:hypothetical protein